jgi:hypothetical protein
MNQEQIVDGVIADYLENKFSGVKEKLSKTSKYFKRGAKASILGTDRKMYELIKTLEEKNQDCTYLTYFDELVNAYRDYVEVADTEVKTHGEVMTPIWLVEDMLDTLPSDVWSNPNLKWLDPCSGVGTYSSIIVQRLMKGLEGFEKNPIKRYRHIIEEMIYVCELQAKNMFIFHCVFDKDDTNELNTYCDSFLDADFDNHMTNVWGVEKFDIVIGNPPYQTSNEGQTKTNPIWDRFVEKSLNILIDGGYLNMVHPSGWRNVDGRFKHIQNMFKNRQVIYLELHSEKDGIKTFGAKTTYDFYTLKNSVNHNHITKIRCIDGTYEDINIFDMDFIPNGKFSEFKKLMSKNISERVNLIHSYSAYETRCDYMSTTKDKTFKFPCVYTTKKDGSISLYYSSTNENGHFGLPKVMWSNGGASTPIIDTNGEYGLTQFAYAIVDNESNLELIRNAMVSDSFIELMKYTDGLVHKYNRKVIATFRKDFYKQFLND